MAIFTAELEAYIRDIPPPNRPTGLALIWKHALPLDPVSRIVLLRAIVEKFPAKKIPSKTIGGKTIDGTDS